MRVCVRRGWSLLEMVVVIAVIGLLLSLLMPAALMTRELARRNACQLQLRQLGLALQQFEQVRRVLPPGALVGPQTTPAHQAFDLVGGPQHGWATFVLPYAECWEWSSQYDWRVDWRDHANQVVREYRWKLLICPATPQADRWDMGQYEVPDPSGGGGAGKLQRWRAAVGDYAPVTGVDTELAQWRLIDPATARSPRGVLSVNDLNSFTRVTDGLSQTLCLVEDAGRPLRYRTRGRWGLQLGSSGQVVGSKVTGAGWSDARSPFVMHGSVREEAGAVPDCAVNCSNDNEIYGFHRGGASGLMADGSVRLLAESLELRCAAQLVTREASELQP